MTRDRDAWRMAATESAAMVAGATSCSHSRVQRGLLGDRNLQLPSSLVGSGLEHLVPQHEMILADRPTVRVTGSSIPSHSAVGASLPPSVDGQSARQTAPASTRWEPSDRRRLCRGETGETTERACQSSRRVLRSFAVSLRHWQPS